ncbi:MAG: putative 3-oxoacyl-[acyl-carrier-protein] reductase, partial [Pseudonocardiales bacterium]|nr:putative 3-oxoacyl-[acyl-carrier-protein] reductase [Pseudonocardiales bacterium]
AAQPLQVRSRIVALSSIEGVFPESGLAAYGASKAALISLIRSINVEENGNGVLATAISPAFVATELSAWATESVPFTG